MELAIHGNRCVEMQWASTGNARRRNEEARELTPKKSVNEDTNSVSLERTKATVSKAILNQQWPDKGEQL